MRVMITESPYATRWASGTDYQTYGIWPCNWVACPDTGPTPFVTAYRRRFSIEADTTIRAHVTADERYELFLDGVRIGRGPERGTPDCWFCESYDLNLAKGSHVLVARVWSLGDLAPVAQLSLFPGFLFAVEDEFLSLLATGVAPWEAKRLDGYSFVAAGHAFGLGAKETIDGRAFGWGFERGEGTGWQPVIDLGPASENVTGIHFRPQHCLAPALLPPMIEERRHVGKVRHVDTPASSNTTSIPVREENNLARETDAWDLLAGRKSITVPAHTRRRVIYDLENYFCAYTEIVVSGGKDSRIHMTWVESLYLSDKVYTHTNWWEKMPKGNRDDIEGKYVLGVGDTFLPDGGANRRFDTLWWRPGRYVELVIETIDEPLTIESFSFRETRYPLEMNSCFTCSDSRIDRANPIILRGLQMCMHETHMDCPAQEQQFYTADTYLAVRTAYVIANDDRMGRKAIRVFNLSRLPCGLTRAAWPTRFQFVVPSFSLCWIATVHDFAWWRDDPAIVRAAMPGIRAVIDGFLSLQNPDGIIDTGRWWNWLDWVPAWSDAIPTASKGGPSAIVNWQLVWTLYMAADLEDIHGEPELAARARRTAAELAKQLLLLFWDDKRDLFADDLAKTGFYEHTQVLALSSGGVTPEIQEKLLHALFSDPDLARTTIYYTHYLLEVCARFDRMDVFFDRMQPWFDLEKEGLKTPYEMPEIATRSDCHGWGGYPLYHYFASILGIRPGSHGFHTVRIEPRLGPLAWARGRMVHPAGAIDADFHMGDGRVQGNVTLPKGLTGTLVCNEREIPLREGGNDIPSPPLSG